MLVPPLNPLGVLLALVPALINLALAITVARQLPHDRVARTFVWFVLFLITWQCFDVGMRWAHTAESAAQWRAAFRIGQLLAVPAGLHFALRLAGEDKLGNHLLTPIVLYGPSMLIAGWYESGLIAETLTYRAVWGFTAAIDDSAYWFFMSAWTSFLAVLSPLVLLRHLATDATRHASPTALRIVAVGMMIPVVVGVVSEAMLPLVGIQQVPMTSTAMTTFSVAAFVALTRYDLFRLEQFEVAASAMANLTEAIVIASPSGRILYANDAALQTLPTDASGERHLQDLLASAHRSAFLNGPFQDCMKGQACLLYTSPSPRDGLLSRMPSSA